MTVAGAAAAGCPADGAAPSAGDRLHDDGWTVFEGFLAPSECETLSSVLAGRRWPRVTEELAGWITAPRWAAVTMPYLGPDVRFVREQVVTKAPRSEAVVPWHQDSGYARIAGEFLTCFVALDDVNVDNGCLWMLSASHHGGVVEHVPQGYLRVIAEPPSDPGEPVPLSSGSMVAFSSLTYHRSGPNRTDGTRPVWMLQFAPGDVRDVCTGAPAAACPVVAEGGRWRERPGREK